MDNEVVLFFGVDHWHHVASGVGEGALVPHLSAALAIEWCAVENQMVELLVLHLHVTVAGDVYLGSQLVVADKLLVHVGH